MVFEHPDYVPDNALTYQPSKMSSDVDFSELHKDD